MEIIQQIGSYAGLAAIVGLAVLSALYFSQARDLRRVRESQGAPRSAPTPQPAQARRPAAAAAEAKPAAAQSGSVGQPAPQVRPVPAAQAPAGASGQRPVPAVAPGTAAAQAGAPGARPQEAERVAPAAATSATAGAGAAAPPSEETSGANGDRSGAASDTEVTDAPRQPAAAKPTDASRGPATATGSPGAPAARTNDSGSGRPLPQRLADQRASGGVPAGRPPWYRRLAPRYLVLIGAAAVVVATGAVFGVTALSTGTGDKAAKESPRDERRAGKDRPPLDPATVTVAVLNGTSVPGLASQTADIVQSAGFARGTIANDSTPSAESAVLFAEGQRQAAREVGKELDISQVEPVDAETQALTGEADVVVVVGADETR